MPVSHTGRTTLAPASMQFLSILPTVLKLDISAEKKITLIKLFME